MSREVVDRFRHSVLPYSNVPQFLSAALGFIGEGIAVDEQVLVAVSRDKIDLLRNVLGDEPGVTFADVADIGRNPVTTIPVWSDFVEQHTGAGRAVRGIGEPVLVSRSPAISDEYAHREALLNLTFGEGPGWQLLCLIDRLAFGSGVVTENCALHPFLYERQAVQPNPTYEPDTAASPRVAQPLPVPLAEPHALSFQRSTLRAVRGAVNDYAAGEGLVGERREDFVLAVDELAGNSIRHGGGEGDLRYWREDRTLLCEISNRGSITDPLAGCRLPDPTQPRGRGLWLVNHLCDLVQVRSIGGTTVVRIHMQL